MNECNSNNKYKQIEEALKNAPRYCMAVGPQGPPGPQGPAGPAATIDSILVDNDGVQTVASNTLADLGEVINTTGTSMTFTAPDTVTVAPGTYLVFYTVLASNGAQSGDVGASLLVNGTVVNNAAEYVPATTEQTQINLQHNFTTTEPATIQIRNASPVPNIYHDSSLSIIKLG